MKWSFCRLREQGVCREVAHTHTHTRTTERGTAYTHLHVPQAGPHIDAQPTENRNCDACPTEYKTRSTVTSRCHHSLIIIIVMGLPLRQHYSPAADVHSTAAAAPSLTCTNAIGVTLQRHTSLLKGRPMNDSVTREQSSMNKNQELTHRGSPGTTCFTRTTRISSFSQRRTTHTTGPRRPCCPS